MTSIQVSRMKATLFAVGCMALLGALWGTKSSDTLKEVLSNMLHQSIEFFTDEPILAYVE